MDYDTKIERILRQLQENLSPELHLACDELKKVMRANMSALLQRMDLVSREEYDIQVDLLERLRQQVAEIEQSLGQYEKQNTDRSSAK